jgi:hypothetical protein
MRAKICSSYHPLAPPVGLNDYRARSDNENMIQCPLVHFRDGSELFFPPIDFCIGGRRDDRPPATVGRRWRRVGKSRGSRSVHGAKRPPALPFPDLHRKIPVRLQSLSTCRPNGPLQLRHSFISTLQAQGVEVGLVAKLAGHKRNGDAVTTPKRCVATTTCISSVLVAELRVRGRKRE